MKKLNICVFSCIVLLNSSNSAANANSFEHVTVPLASPSTYVAPATVNDSNRYVPYWIKEPTNQPIQTSYERFDFRFDRLTGETVKSKFPSNFSGGFNNLKNLMSTDGRYSIFSSDQADLVPNDTNNERDVFVYDLETQTHERVSVSSSGEQAIGGRSVPRAISPNGRFVVFESAANNLAANDNSLLPDDLFVHDRETGTTKTVNFDQNGEAIKYAQFNIVIASNNGNVAFGSDSRQYSEGDVRVFLYDQNRVKSANVSSSNRKSFGSDELIDLSADGRYVLFNSSYQFLVDGDTNGKADAFVHDLQTKTTERVSLSESNEQLEYNDGWSPYLSGHHNGTSISGDGRYVLFTSESDNAYANDNNGLYDLFIRDRVNNETRVVTRPGADLTSLGNNIMSARLTEDGNTIQYSQRSYSGPTYQTNANGELAVNLVFTQNPFLKPYYPQLGVVTYFDRNDKDESTKNVIQGTMVEQFYQVTNTSSERIYGVKVYDNNELVCNLYSLNPGQTKDRCRKFKEIDIYRNGADRANIYSNVYAQGTTVTSGDIVNGSDYALMLAGRFMGGIKVTHWVNNVNADKPELAKTLDSNTTKVLFKVENTGVSTLYNVKTYHDSVAPTNGSWVEVCKFPVLERGEVRYCKGDITLDESGLHHSIGRALGANAKKGATKSVRDSNSTYFVVP